MSLCKPRKRASIYPLHDYARGRCKRCGEAQVSIAEVRRRRAEAEGVPHPLPHRLLGSPCALAPL